jgi:exocyst complex component 2
VSEENSKRAAVQQHRRILEKVWEQVERVMSDMRASLLEKLSDTEGVKTVEEQERTIECVVI